MMCKRSPQGTESSNCGGKAYGELYVVNFNYSEQSRRRENRSYFFKRVVTAGFIEILVSNEMHVSILSTCGADPGPLVNLEGHAASHETRPRMNPELENNTNRCFWLFEMTAGNVR